MLRNPSRIFLFILLPLAWLAGCASTPTVGVRPQFEGRTVTKIAVVPFYASGTFSQSPETIEKQLRLYEDVAVEWLRQSGFTVTSPEEFTGHLEEKDGIQQFRDGLTLDRDLARYFEPASDPQDVSSAVATLRDLHSTGKLPDEVLLFGQVVYQSMGTCQEDPRKYNPHAELIALPGVEGQASAPCVVSHFQAKLVDASTGETMWHNRRLREIRVQEVTPEVRNRNIGKTVIETLGGEHGLLRFRSSSTAKVTGQL